MKNFDDALTTVSDGGADDNGSLTQTISARIRAIRKRKDMTLREVAEHANTTAQTIQRLETGQMTISLGWLERICRALNVTPDTLFADALILDSEAVDLLNDAKAFQIHSKAFHERLDHFIKQAVS